MELCFRFPCAGSDYDAFIADLWEANTTGVVEEDDGAVLAFFEEEPSEIVWRWGGQSTTIKAEDFSADKQDWEGICAGEQFYVAQPWVRSETPPGRTRITLYAGPAFGSGRHESTQLMIAAMERIIKPGQTVIDAGCGSGILSEAARLLGAGRVIGCDIDELAIRNALDNFENPAFIGSVDAIAAESADVVLANISARVIDLLAGEIRRVMKPAGRYLLSGFIESRVPEAFRPDGTTKLDEWLCWLGTRETITAASALEPLHHPARWW